MKGIAAGILLLLITLYSFSQSPTITLTRQQLKDKIMGGWAGQTIGVTFGGPYEFQFNGTFIGDYQPLKWYDGYLKHTMVSNPGLYDDLYMDLTFVDVFERLGLNAPVDSFANAFASAGYMLWHANQAARYNILNKIPAPASGHWKNNPHADCIDYQIESDFAGLMSPGMPNEASAISDKIGHIMNYGDGWYGGVFMGAMYALAFTSNKIEWIVQEALKTIPAKSEFYKTIETVISSHKKNPKEWKQAWLEVQNKWANDIGCPDGVFAPFNIDAKVNAAYVVIGLLYGNGDFTRTLEITTRCGQDADCNPSSSAGILGTILGYGKIPAYWKMGLKEAESIDFKYTTMSLQDVYEIGFKHALQTIEKNGGKITDDEVVIKVQRPQPVRYEKSFEGLYPKEKLSFQWTGDEFSFEFEGVGFAVRGETARWAGESTHVTKAEVYVDGNLTDKIDLPASFTTRRFELCWKYGLAMGKHKVRVKIFNPPGDMPKPTEAIIYTDKPVNGISANIK